VSCPYLGIYLGSLFCQAINKWNAMLKAGRNEIGLTSSGIALAKKTIK
jgi:hypothetical protein